MCQFSSLSKCLSPSDVRTALSSLPRTLDETYERILVNIPMEYRSRAINALKWIIYNKSYFELDELADATVINHEADPPFNLGDRLSDPSWLLVILPGLITIDNYDYAVQVAHFSVVEYLESAWIVDGPANVFHLERSKAVISIIKDCFGILKSYTHPINQKLLEDKAGKFSPLEWQVWKYWGNSVESLDTPIDREISRLVVDFAVNMKSIGQRHHYTLQPTPWSKAFIEGPGKPLDNGLYTACYLRASNMARILLDAGADIHFDRLLDGTALQVAARRDWLDMVRVLLDAGADVNSQAGYEGTALQLAASGGHLDMVKILLDAGADINLKSEKYETALQAAAIHGKRKIVQVLLDVGADINSQDRNGITVLQNAVVRGDLGMVKSLLEAGADVNLAGREYGIALQAAAVRNMPEMVQLLLNAGADINSRTGDWGTALQIAAARGYLGIVKLLLESGADVNLTYRWYGTALQAAQTYKHEQVVDMLLKAGAK